jgi:hypothetical protein
LQTATVSRPAQEAARRGVSSSWGGGQHVVAIVAMGGQGKTTLAVNR